MKITISHHFVRLELSLDEVARWQDDARWPGLEAKPLEAEFTFSGLIGHEGFGAESVDAFNAICFDHLVPYIPPSHPCYEVVIGQFRRF